MTLWRHPLLLGPLGLEDLCESHGLSDVEPPHSPSSRIGSGVIVPHAEGSAKCFWRTGGDRQKDRFSWYSSREDSLGLLGSL